MVIERNHIMRKLAQKEYKTRHESVGKRIPWEICKKFKFDPTNKCYMHNPASVLDNDTWTILGLWHTNGSPNLGQMTRPYNNQQKKKKRTCTIANFAVPSDNKIKLKESEKRDKSPDLARELKKERWNVKVKIIPIVIGSFGTVTKELLK